MPTVIPHDLFDDDDDGNGADGGRVSPVTQTPATVLREDDATGSRSARGPEGAEVAPQYPAAPARQGATEPKVEVPRANKPLTKGEKAQLAMLAKRVWDQNVAHHVIDPNELSADDFRHREIERITGGRASGLRELTHRDFREVRRELFTMLGDLGRAFADALKDQPERADWEQAWFKLEEACRQGKVGFPSYPAAIARAQYRSALGDCTARQLWALFYTVRNRTKKNRER